MTYDVIVIGAGPTGLSFSKALNDCALKVLVIDQVAEDSIEHPQYDGREIALTHSSKNIMQTLGQWESIPHDRIGLIKEAKVSSGNAPMTLDFDSQTSGHNCLGYMVSNQNIKKACFDAVQHCEHIDFCFGQQVQSVKTGDHLAQVTLADGQTISTQLVVAADSRFSQSRRQMGIPTDRVDFGRTCIVFTMKTEKPHHFIAREIFGYDKTVAILPLANDLVSVVITIASHKASQIMNSPTMALAAEIAAKIDHELGDMIVHSELFSYPLVATMASQFYGRRYALIGDAAVGMHPVTAHGFNLGLSSAWQLADLIKKARNQNLPFYEYHVLRSYHRKHKRKSVPIFTGTQLIVKLFTKNHLWAKVTRHAVLKLSKHVKPVSHFITKQLTQV